MEAIKREYGEVKSGKKPNNLDNLCEKTGFDKKIVYADLESLVKLNIIGKGDKDDYCWTNEGILTIPEYAFKVPTDCTFLTGDVATLMNKMFGDYWETVQFIKDALKISKKKANEAFKIVLGEHILFLKWLRDHAFDMTGIPELNDVTYYRKQMMNFLLSYCLMICDPDLIEANTEYRNFCNILVRKLIYYFKNYHN